ncbi:MAG: hypothetical protein GX801_08990, partial [Fibrobacter sp.]|nr:hypothetical protein [Fibrobacter sp.]
MKFLVIVFCFTMAAFAQEDIWAEVESAATDSVATIAENSETTDTLTVKTDTAVAKIDTVDTVLPETTD